MTSLKDRYAALKQKREEQAQKDAEEKKKKELAAEETKAKKAEEEAKQKAAEEAKKNDPAQIAAHAKQKTKQAQKAEEQRIKAEKKEIKRKAIIDKKLTKIFNRLNNDDLIFKALEKDEGLVKQRIGGFNTVGEYLKSGFGLATRNHGRITQDDLENNKAYQKYVERLDQEGFEIEFIEHDNSSGMWSLDALYKALGVNMTALGIVGATTFLPFALFIPGGMSVVGMTNYWKTSFTIKIKEKAMAPSNDTEKSCQKDSSLLDELNQQQLTQPEAVKVPVKTKQNIIR